MTELDDQAPDFKCPDCGRSVGARKPDGDWNKPWQPQSCFWCRRKVAQCDANKRRRENPRALGGVDVDAAVKALRSVEPLGSLLGRRKIEVSVGHTAASGVGGRAWTRRSRMRVHGGPRAAPERVLEVVLHELCHLALPCGTHHGERFRRTFARAAHEAWGIEIPIEVDRLHHQNKSYRMGAIATEKLHELIVQGVVSIFPIAATTPKPPRAVVTRALVEKRAAHAVAMLARAERKLKLAKTLHKKWAAKVRYYERAAAKRK